MAKPGVGRLPPGKALGLLTFGTGLGWIVMKIVTPSEEKLYSRLSPDLKLKVDQRRAESKEWDKTYGNTTVIEQYEKSVKRDK
ncbi:hypothetical protein BY996DRAFT_7111908 [Phakopsora pachyrhizi]|uniref:Cytochrome b mRNA-processing protein 4 n=1 Tax=Phakopsora pachyrhizi TaxID=170000 RepID=A0AAV0BCT9_PHAPC|nr:hypothetical protein BY996DRAFT_7111908 [Phakopsora pachyrhizi]CAH7671412.1 hypothetical protein PPACK8108_LOCUS6184 [Phakopsora pachyrhizi]CAH7684955.1 hypothetical protein PPACK8108_LOCUS19407 [Phakopsora pachyrhizi]